MLLSELVLNSDLTTLFEMRMQDLSCVPRILERISSLSKVEEVDGSLDKIAAILKSSEILQRGKRDIMEDIVAQYSSVFGTKSKPGKKKQPVVFLPNPSSKACKKSGQMSSFGYLAFVLSMINGVVNAANNINNNQNNNNNNDNNNNDNNNNVNVANSNNNQANDNMATAGRRRRLDLPEEDRNEMRKILAEHLRKSSSRNVTQELWLDDDRKVSLPLLKNSVASSSSRPEAAKTAAEGETNPIKTWWRPDYLYEGAKSLVNGAKNSIMSFAGSVLTSYSKRTGTSAASNPAAAVSAEERPLRRNQRSPPSSSPPVDMSMSEVETRDEDVLRQSLLAAFMFMDFWSQKIGSRLAGEATTTTTTTTTSSDNVGGRIDSVSNTTTSTASTVSAIKKKATIEKAEEDGHLRLKAASASMARSFLHNATSSTEVLERRDFCILKRALDKIGPWAKLIGRPLAVGMATYLEEAAAATGNDLERDGIIARIKHLYINDKPCGDMK